MCQVEVLSEFERGALKIKLLGHQDRYRAREKRDDPGIDWKAVEEEGRSLGIPAFFFQNFINFLSWGYFKPNVGPTCRDAFDLMLKFKSLKRLPINPSSYSEQMRAHVAAYFSCARA